MNISLIAKDDEHFSVGIFFFCKLSFKEHLFMNIFLLFNFDLAYVYV